MRLRNDLSTPGECKPSVADVNRYSSRELMHPKLSRAVRNRVSRGCSQSQLAGMRRIQRAFLSISSALASSALASASLPISL